VGRQRPSTQRTRRWSKALKSAAPEARTTRVAGSPCGARGLRNRLPEGPGGEGTVSAAPKAPQGTDGAKPGHPEPAFVEEGWAARSAVPREGDAGCSGEPWSGPHVCGHAAVGSRGASLRRCAREPRSASVDLGTRGLAWEVREAALPRRGTELTSGCFGIRTSHAKLLSGGTGQRTQTLPAREGGSVAVSDFFAREGGTPRAEHPDLGPGATRAARRDP